MPTEDFRPPRRGDKYGVVAFGGGLAPERLLAAYRQGVFPWPMEGTPTPWCCPVERAVLFFDELHVPRRLARLMRRGIFRQTVDQDFEGVIRGCSASPRAGQPGTWITPEMIEAYTRLHRMGHAHSVETWDGSRLVGGIYGVSFDGCFAGESMFHTVPNGSMPAFLTLVEHLRAAGLGWMDVQLTTPHLVRFGVRAIGRAAYLKLLERTRDPGRKLIQETTKAQRHEEGCR